MQLETSLDIERFKEFQKRLIHDEKKRLGILRDTEVQHVNTDENEHQVEAIPAAPDLQRSVEGHVERNREFRTGLSTDGDKQNAPLVERLNLSCNEASLEKEKQAFIDRLVHSENPLTFRSNGKDHHQSAMLRYGEYSPNNPLLRVATAPYLGVGEYEQRKQLLLKQQRADYKEHINKKNEHIKNTVRNLLIESKPTSTGQTKSVQTDIQNINNKLVQYQSDFDNPSVKDCSPESANSDKENIYITSSNLQQHNRESSEMDKPRSILSNRRTESPRERLLSDLQHAYVPSCLDGFSYHDRADEIQRERLKRELYQQELRMQIEEKRRITELKEEQEKREQERENRRLEQQLLRMQEEQLKEEQRRNRRDEQSRRSSEEYLRRKQELQVRPASANYRKHLEMESSLRNTNVASHYSPPVSRRSPYSSYTVPTFSSSHSDPTSRYSTSRYHESLSRKDALNRMDSLSIHEPRDRFSRYDSLSRIDALKQDTINRLETLNINDSLNRVQRRHSATQQDLSLIRRSPKMQRRCSSSRLDDPLPIPVLKAHSPVARELRNSVAINSSRHTSDAVRKLEDKWQIPAVQKTIINHGDLLTEGHNRRILTQLGAIRMQLQKEQLRMDETLRQRANTQSKAVNFH